MRSRQDIETDSKAYDRLSLETLLDIRDLLTPKNELKAEAVEVANSKVTETAKPKKKRRVIKHRKKRNDIISK